MRKRQRIPRWILMAFFTATLSSLLVASAAVQASEPTQAVHRVSVELVDQAVIGELRSRAIGEEQLPGLEDIELPLAVPMRSGSSLRVLSVCWDQDAERIRFQLACSHSGECLPFLAYVRTARNYAPACHLASSHAGHSKSESGVRAGERASAVLSKAGIRINAPVTCLQGGDLGDIIQVRGHEGRIFRARIIGPSMVDAGLE
jgi:hypothetical protein